MSETRLLHPVTPPRASDWSRCWSHAGAEAIRRADASLDCGLLAAACESYLAAARYYWLALSGPALRPADRRALEDAHAAAFRAAVPMLPHPATPFTVQVDDTATAGYLFLPAGATAPASVVLRAIRPSTTAESGYWQVALPILDSGIGCAVFTAAATRISPITSAVARWAAQQPGVGAVIDPELDADTATAPPSLNRSRS